MASFLVLRSGSSAGIWHTAILPTTIHPPDARPSLPTADAPAGKAPMPAAGAPPSADAGNPHIDVPWVRAVTVDSLDHAQRLLRQIAVDDAAVREIRAAVFASPTGYGIRAFDDHEVVAQAAARVAAGLIRLLEELEIPRVVAPGGSASAGPAEPPPPAAPAKKKTKSWVGIELIDEDGNPVAGADYSITAPNGAEYEGKLDSRGRARVDDIDPGTCTVAFPGLDKFSWAPVATS